LYTRRDDDDAVTCRWSSAFTADAHRSPIYWKTMTPSSSTQADSTTSDGPASTDTNVIDNNRGTTTTTTTSLRYLNCASRQAARHATTLSAELALPQLTNGANRRSRSAAAAADSSIIGATTTTTTPRGCVAVQTGSDRTPPRQKYCRFARPPCAAPSTAVPRKGKARQ